MIVTHTYSSIFFVAGMKPEAMKTEATPSLPLEIWQMIADRLRVKEWVSSCGSACRAFNQVQPRRLYLPTDLDKEGLAVLKWAAKHWNYAEEVYLIIEEEVRGHNWQYYPKNFVPVRSMFFCSSAALKLFSMSILALQEFHGPCDELHTIGESLARASAIKVADVTAFTSLFGPEKARFQEQFAGFLHQCLRTWSTVENLSVYAHSMHPMPPLDRLVKLKLSLLVVDDTVLESLQGMQQLQNLKLRSGSGSTKQMQCLDLTGLTHLQEIELENVVPHVCSMGPNIVLKIAGEASFLEGKSWLTQHCWQRLEIATSIFGGQGMSSQFQGLLQQLAWQRRELQGLRIHSYFCEQHLLVGPHSGKQSHVPDMHALKQLYIKAQGSMSICIPWKSALDKLSLETDNMDITVECPDKFACQLRSVRLYYSHTSTEGMEAFVKALRKAVEDGRGCINKVFSGHSTDMAGTCGETFGGIFAPYAHSHAVVALSWPY